MQISHTHQYSLISTAIHQPSSEVFNAFDHLILLNKGLVMYNGSVKAVPDYFEHRSHPVPPNFNPADWIMSVAQQIPVEQLKSDGFFEAQPVKGAAPAAEGRNALGDSVHSVKGDSKDSKKPGFLTQASMLYSRELKNLVRDKASIAVRFGITIFLNLLFGIIFRDVGKQPNSDTTNIQSHFGALVMVVLSSMFGSAQPALFAIPGEFYNF